MDINQLNQWLQANLGKSFTEDEKNALIQIAQNEAKNTKLTDVFVQFLRSKGFNDDKIENILDDVMALSGMLLLRYIVDNTTEVERKNFEDAAKLFSPMQQREILSIILEKNMNKSLDDLSDYCYREVVDAYMNDIDIVLDAVKEVKQ